MKTIPNKIHSLALISSLSLLSVPLLASDDQNSGFTLSPAVGLLTQSTDVHGLKDTTSASIAAGYQFSSPWAVELVYTAAQPDWTVGNGDTDLAQLRLDALYHFGFRDEIQPYLVAGVGSGEYDYGTWDQDETVATIGLGLKQAINDVLSIRTDLRAVRGSEFETTQTAFNVGLQLLLGGKSSPKVKQPVDVDSDNDGVVDRLDSCLNTPAGTRVDASGCAINDDLDGDGVVNAKDNCPDTKAGARVDEKGCYLVLKEDVTVELNVKFANNSDVVVGDSFEEVAELAQFMREFPQTRVEIKGHTDDRGAASYNKQLSQKRADAVAALLVNNYGVEARRISAVGYGEEQPAATNDTAEGRAQNRRVEGVVSATRERVLQ